MVLTLRPGRREHIILCMLAVAIGAALLTLGALLLVQKIPKPACSSALQAAEVGIGESEAANVDFTLIALGAPIVVSGVFLVWWGLRGNFAALQLKRDPSAHLRPFTKQALLAFSVAAICLWISLFISFFAAPVLKELCGNYHCSPIWAGEGAVATADLECYGVHADLRATCDSQDVCCGCKASWNGGGEPRLVCAETVSWACEAETLEVIISYASLFFAVILTAAAFFFYLVVRGRFQNCIDIGDSCEADGDDDVSKGPDVQTLGPTIEDEPSPSVSPSSREPKAIADRQLSPASGSVSRREPVASPSSEPPRVVQYEFSV